MSIPDFLHALEGKSVVILTHKNADPDAVGCAFVMQRICQQYRVHAEVYLPEGPSGLSKKILGTLGFTWQSEHPDSNAVIVCDTSNVHMLGEAGKVAEQASALLIIDHHKPPGNLVEKASITVLQEEPASTVLAVKIAEALKVDLDSKLSTLALTGIVYDTRRFMSASPATFHAAKWLLEMGGDYSLALKLLEEEEDRSEIIAKLKGVQRASILDVCGYIVAVSEVSSHEASVARALVSLGADLAIVAGGRDISRASIRVSGRLLERGFDSSRLVYKVAKELGGEGGGHSGASGIVRHSTTRGLRWTRSEELRQLVARALEMIWELCG